MRYTEVDDKRDEDLLEIKLLIREQNKILGKMS